MFLAQVRSWGGEFFPCSGGVGLVRLESSRLHACRGQTGASSCGTCKSAWAKGQLFQRLVVATRRSTRCEVTEHGKIVEIGCVLVRCFLTLTECMRREWSYKCILVSVRRRSFEKAGAHPVCVSKGMHDSWWFCRARFVSLVGDWLQLLQWPS